MSIKNLRVLAFFLVVAFMLSSCNKDNEIEEMVDPPVTENATTYNNFSGMVSSTTNTETEGCYDITFPITFLLEDNTTVTADSEQDLEAIFESAPYPVDWVYPLNLVDIETGETTQANDEEELLELFIGCIDEEWEWEEGEFPCDSVEIGSLDCYEIVFPVSFVLEDGSTVTAQDESELGDILVSNNPPEDFVYPVQLVDEDGVTHTANSAEELEDLFEECEEDWEIEIEEDGVFYLLSFASIDMDPTGGGFENCYSYNYPISVVTDDGSTLTLNSDDETVALIFSGTEIEDFVYPIEVTSTETGETLTAEDAEEVIELLEEC